MAKVRVDLGGRAYLWKDANAYAPSVVISAHGFYRPNPGQYQPGAPTLLFYCAHDETVNDVPQSTRVDQERVVETVPQGNVTSCTNYVLFKFQEHSGDIKDYMKDQNRKGNQITFADAEDDLGQSFMGGETYGTFRNVNDQNNDYVTIRWRHWSKGGHEITLQNLVTLILNEHNYATIKCCFCREPKPADFRPT
jgi:hypothetical protein